MTVLLVDNYDSFTFNLYQQIARCGVEVVVHRNDAIDLDDFDRIAPSHVVLSPGPGHPEVARDFGICAAILAHRASRQPILGVCLGHQGIVHHFGGRITHAPAVVHGKTSRIRHEGDGVFAGLPETIEVMRYHSLAAADEDLPEALVVAARSVDDDVIMAVRHRQLPVHGVQFHPESIGTACGDQVVKNFLEQS